MLLLLHSQRSAKINRETKETQIKVNVKLEGVGSYKIKTGIGFFDHMLEQLSRKPIYYIEEL